MVLGRRTEQRHTSNVDLFDRLFDGRRRRTRHALGERVEVADDDADGVDGLLGEVREVGLGLAGEDAWARDTFPISDCPQARRCAASRTAVNRRMKGLDASTEHLRCARNVGNIAEARPEEASQQSATSSLAALARLTRWARRFLGQPWRYRRFR